MSEIEMSFDILLPTEYISLCPKFITCIAFEGHSISDSITMYGWSTGRSISNKKIA